VNEYQAAIALMGALGVTYTRANKTPVALESGSLIVHWRARRAEVPRGVTFFGGAVTSMLIKKTHVAVWLVTQVARLQALLSPPAAKLLERQDC
jgi:hypothetical protein